MFIAAISKLVCIAAIGMSVAPAPTAPGGRTSATGHLSLELDGTGVGPISAVEGGDGIGEKLGVDKILAKQFANVRFQDISLRCGLGMGEQLYNWVSAHCRGSSPRHTGAIVLTDTNFKPIQRLEFTGAVLSEVEFPALNDTSRGPVFMRLHVSPAATRVVSLRGQRPQKPRKPVESRWPAADFMLAIQGLDCTTVSNVSTIAVRQKVVESLTGELREFPLNLTHGKHPSLVVTLPDANAQAFFAWQRQSRAKRNDAARLKSGHLMYLASDRRTPVFALSFHNLAITRVALEPSGSATTRPSRVKAEMVCDRIDFAYSAAATRAGVLNHAANPPRGRVESVAGEPATGNLTHAQ